VTSSLGGDQTLSSPLRVVVGEDQPIVRAGVVHVLKDAGFEVVAVAGNADDLVLKTRAHDPSVVVTDIQMPPNRGDDGLRAARQIRTSQPNVGVLVLSQFLEDRYPLELLGDRAEGVGYLLKDRIAEVETFTDAVRRVAGGGTVLDPEVVNLLVGRHRNRSAVEGLSPREKEVLALMAQGVSNSGIAEALVVTLPAVERHVGSVFSKLDLPPAAERNRRVLAVLEYLRR
jgi:DNA-binding NarL/FixJ family response regulator